MKNCWPEINICELSTYNLTWENTSIFITFKFLRFLYYVYRTFRERCISVIARNLLEGSH